MLASMLASSRVQLAAASNGGISDKARALGAPDPNLNRADDYPNTWRIELNKQTALCKVCSHSLAGTKWCVYCNNCSKRFCSSCWNGTRVNRYGEPFFEGKAQNDEGCWCRFPGNLDPRYKPAFEARTARMKQLINEENLQQQEQQEHDLREAIQRPAKKARLANDRMEGMMPRVSASSSEASTPPKDPFVGKPLSQHQRNKKTPRKDSRYPHLEGKTTIIVGAGIIGLTIARELAAAVTAAGTDHKIIVVEARDKYAELASHECAGIITGHGVPKGYDGLLAHSLNAWRSLLSSDYTKERLRFSPSGVVHVKAGLEDREKHPEMRPPWHIGSDSDMFDEYESDVGKISTRHFAKWLYAECNELKVEFRFHQEICMTYKTMQAELMGVLVTSTLEGDTREVKLQCNNIIVAAGPWTSEVLWDIVALMPEIDNHQEHYEWIRVPREDIEENEDVGLLLEDTKDTKGAMITAQPSSNEILVAAVGNKRVNNYKLPNPPRVKHGVEGLNTDKVRGMAAQALEGFQAAQGVTKGRSLISTSTDRLPLIDKIPALLIDGRFLGVDDNPLGIYVACGFGRYGTTLSLGVAAMLRRMICRDEPMMDFDGDFTLPVPE